MRHEAKPFGPQNRLLAVPFPRYVERSFLPLGRPLFHFSHSQFFLHFLHYLIHNLPQGYQAWIYSFCPPRGILGSPLHYIDHRSHSAFLLSTIRVGVSRVLWATAAYHKFPFPKSALLCFVIHHSLFFFLAKVPLYLPYSALFLLCLRVLVGILLHPFPHCAFHVLVTLRRAHQSFLIRRMIFVCL